MGSIKKGKKEGVFIEGRKSKPHKHKSGKKGSDIYAAKVTYKGGKKGGEKRAKGWGKTKT